MNKLLTAINGGLPLTLDRVRWLDDAYTNAWLGFLSAFGITSLTSFKLSGCVVTINGNDYTTTAGYISLNGEILPVDAHTVTKQFGEIIIWSVEETYDSSGNVVFFDQTSHDLYQVRKGKLISHAPTMPPIYMPYNALYLSDVILAFNPTEENWHYVGTQGEPAFQHSWANLGSGYQSLRYKKDLAGYLHIEGIITGGSLNNIVFTLPAGYFNSDEQGCIIWSVDTTIVNKGILGVIITPAGFVYLNDISNGQIDQVFLTITPFKIN